MKMSVSRVLPVNKSIGVSTYDCIRRFKKVISVDKIGHAGTLDPQAAGLILLLTGEATKLSNYLMDLPKRYVADIKVGEATDTQDASGKVLRTGDWNHVSRRTVESALKKFTGRRMQTPPMFSALKHRGTPLYLLARRGQKIDRKPREVETYEIKLVSLDLPVFRIEVFCSRGLYIRVLAEEIGEALGVPAHLYSLVRTSIGHFSLDSAVPDDDLGSFATMDEPGFTLSEALKHMPTVTITDSQAAGLEHGITPNPAGPVPPMGSLVRLVRPDGDLGAIGEIGPGNVMRLKRVFRNVAER